MHPSSFANEIVGDGSRDQSNYRSTQGDNDVWGIGLRGEQVTDQIGGNAYDASNDGAKKDSCQNNGQILKCEADSSATEVEKILAENADDHTDRSEHCGGCQLLVIGEWRCVFVFFHKKDLPFHPYGGTRGDGAVAQL